MQGNLRGYKSLYIPLGTTLIFIAKFSNTTPSPHSRKAVAVQLLYLILFTFYFYFLFLFSTIFCCGSVRQSKLTIRRILPAFTIVSYRNRIAFVRSVLVMRSSLGSRLFRVFGVSGLNRRRYRRQKTPLIAACGATCGPPSSVFARVFVADPSLIHRHRGNDGIRFCPTDSKT